MRPDATGGPPNLELHVETRDSTVQVTVGGELDMDAAFTFEPRVESVLETQGVQAVVLDLTRVSFMDSAGLGALVQLRERAEQLHIELSIAGVSDAVRRILEVTGLSGIAEP